MAVADLLVLYVGHMGQTDSLYGTQSPSNTQRGKTWLLGRRHVLSAKLPWPFPGTKKGKRGKWHQSYVPSARFRVRFLTLENLHKHQMG